MSTAFDVIVIGAGPGGYIPSKALLQSSEEFHHAAHGLADHGVIAANVSFDLARMQARKGEVVGANVKGVEFLFKKNKVTWLKGTGRIAAPTASGFGQVDVDGTSYGAKHIVIAAGSEGMPLAGVEGYRQLHRRAGTERGAEASRGHRRRRHRP